MAGYTAFVEGWGLYAESLGEEMGLYDDPYSKFGQLTYEMWRAARLVVDTGIHYMRWDRQKAIDSCQRTRPSRYRVVERNRPLYFPCLVRRSLTKSASSRFSAIRAKAEKALGAKFDIRTFHDGLSRTGALPLDLLKARWTRGWQGSLAENLMTINNAPRDCYSLRSGSNVDLWLYAMYCF